MSDKDHKKSRRIPTVPSNRIDESPSNSGVSYKKEDQQANAFIKGKEPTQPITLRLPDTLHKKLRALAFISEDKITHIILRAIREHIKNEEIQYGDLLEIKIGNDI